MFIALQLSRLFSFTHSYWGPYSNLAELNGKHYCYYTKRGNEDQQAIVCKQSEITQLVTDLGQVIESFSLIVLFLAKRK